jgi:hypothetical protein
MAAGTVPGAASIYLRFIIQPTAAPDVTPTTSVVAIVARKASLTNEYAREGQPTAHRELHKNDRRSMLASALPVARLISKTSGSSRPKGSIQLEVHRDRNYHRSYMEIPLGEPSS